MEKISRRKFLKATSGVFMLSVLGGAEALAMNAFEPAKGVENPMKHYPDRNWEKVYRDIYKPDSSYIFTCTPNCTHNCYLRAYVKNGVVVRVGPSQNYHKATDVYGTKASQRWDPRHCNKGIALVRRFYGDRRVKGAMVRKGFLTWVEKGFPRDADGIPPAEYFKRGEDQYVQLPWEKAYEIAAKTFYEISKTYSGDSGAALLKRQDYDEEMIKRMGGAGTRAMKFRGGMPALGSIKLFGQYRTANSMALLDKHIRKVDDDKAVGSVGLDNYTWHTDLPPGHPMVCGQQTIDFDLSNVEYTNIVACWGINWISTKMPDGHWLTEARLKGKKVLVITAEYSSTCSKADEIVIIRPGTDPALALGVAHVLIKENLYDKGFVKTHTDLPMLVRMDTGNTLKATEVFSGYKNKELKLKMVVKTAADLPKPTQTNVGMPAITEEMRNEWGDFVMWDTKTSKPVAVSSDDVGEHFKKLGIEPAIEGEFTVSIGGKDVKVRPVFDIVKQHVMDTWTPENTEKITWAPKSAIISMARQFAANPEKVLFTVGMGPNQFFNADQKDRAIFLIAAMTRNVGFFGGNVGSYAGNYRAAYFNGLPQYMAENPFDITLDPTKSAKVKMLFAFQSAHYYSHGDQPLKVHGKYFNGKTHMPFPTKAMWFSASNSILGNAKGHYEIVMNLLRHPVYRAKGEPKRLIEAVFTNEWWWTGTCEYSDIVFGVDSWAEYNISDMTQSCTNPFMQVMPLGEIKRIHNTKSNTETYKGVAAELAKLTGDKRFNDYWAFIDEKHRAKPYMQRVLNHSNMFKGYDVDDLLAKAKDGIPALMMGKTYPKFIGYEQSNESAPWYNRTGRLEFYRDEQEFKDYGECIPLHREPIDSTFYEPNTIVAAPHPLIKPKTPEDYGFSRADLSRETRQVRNVVYTVDELLKTQHPLIKDKFNYIWLTPKYRHSVHTMFADIDYMSVWWGPFGDMYRKDKRKPWVGEGYLDIHPEDAKAYNIDDGDYIWVDADPEDMPFKGWQERPHEYKVARCMLRARYYPGTPRGVIRTWFNLYMASFGSVKGHETRKDGLAKNPDTGYQSMYRYGGHQSGTRSWLRPTLLTDTLVRKDLMGQAVGKGFAPDVHCANGAPRESFAKFSKAEDGGESGKGKWRPITLGGRPTYESAKFKDYLNGKFVG
ncbi:molybdopterin-dependent oxidoreductase [Candidatus Magnetominusculus xianensis]|uniref:Nitrate oxidoreductase subunit alpha n=1 Tax=Candidatus Magnetominusculus xianensis TaxID=1748249 RepID=A0ABR5SFK0_9BACT|nr:molybdopterin-dependent oxidoreductase [Candidatus Magnetominusculus xianensis]KWT84149.1 nitrate oxidoreductase subunit alpha [Candidatus Magnetominusculus xianensis]MBF0402441.1 molybdopterin-dependent oxidoreductase [Nitrospirota bacterium]